MYSGGRILVLGSGVIGLNTAQLIRQHLGANVVIYADQLVRETTSFGAGGLWFPFHCEPEALVRKWGKETYIHYLQRYKKGDRLIEEMPFFEFMKKKPNSSHQAWSHGFHDNLRVRSGKTESILNEVSLSDHLATNLPFYWGFHCLIVDSPRELEQIESDLEKDPRVNLMLKNRKLSSIEEVNMLAKDLACTVVVNCTGLGSNQLLLDEEIKPAKGVVLNYERPSTMSYCAFLNDENEEKPNYIIPRGEVVVAGGTFYEGDQTDSVSEQDEQRIDTIAKELSGSLKKSQRIGTWVGFRPFRENGINFEVSKLSDGRNLVNNYGHGGSGWTIGYGAALHNIASISKLL